MKSWVMSKQVKLGERLRNVDTPGKAAQPAVSHRSPLVYDQLPSTPFLSFSLWRDENSSILKGKQLLSNPVTALILWSSTFQPLSEKYMLHSCFTNDILDVLWSYIHKNIKWVTLLSYFPKGKVQYSHFNTFFKKMGMLLAALNPLMEKVWNK